MTVYILHIKNVDFTFINYYVTINSLFNIKNIKSLFNIKNITRIRQVYCKKVISDIKKYS